MREGWLSSEGCIRELAMGSDQPDGGSRNGDRLAAGDDLPGHGPYKDCCYSVNGAGNSLAAGHDLAQRPLFVLRSEGMDCFCHACAWRTLPSPVTLVISSTIFSFFSKYVFWHHAL
ncbi:hypothetical protein D3C79_911420 [compost metagenome]